MSKSRSPRGTASVSLPVNYYNKVRGLAEEENRTTSNMISVLVKEALQARGKLGRQEADEDEPRQAA